MTRRRRRGAWLIATWCLCLAGCGGGDDSPTGGDGGGGDGELTEQVSAAQLEGWANGVYDSLAARQGGTEAAVREVLDAFDFQVLPLSDEAALETALDSGAPVMTETQLAGIVRAFGEERVVSVDSYLASLADQGAEIIDPAAPLNREALDAFLQQIGTDGPFDWDEALCALVMTLGRERASRGEAGITDAVWGDDWLDPLQFNLLTYGIYMSCGTAADSRADTGPILRFGVRGVANAVIEKLIKIPVSPLSAPRAAICASELLYAYQMQVSLSEPLVARKAADVPLPSETEATATLAYTETYTDAERSTFERLTSCELPAAGPATGKPVEWKIGADLAKHGAYASQDAATGPDGKARAVFATVDETVPKPLRRLAASDSGLLTVIARGLLPEKWKNLEQAIGLGIHNPTGAQGDARLEVRYYTMPDLKLTFESNQRYAARGGQTNNTVRVVEVPMELVQPEGDGAPYYQCARDYNFAGLSFNAPCVSSYTQRLPGRLEAEMPLPATSDTTLTVYLTPLQGNPPGPSERLVIQCGGSPAIEIETGDWIGGWGTMHQERFEMAAGPLARPRYVFTAAAGTGPLFEQTFARTKVVDELQVTENTTVRVVFAD